MFVIISTNPKCLRTECFLAGVQPAPSLQTFWGKGAAVHRLSLVQASTFRNPSLIGFVLDALSARLQLSCGVRDCVSCALYCTRYETLVPRFAIDNWYTTADMIAIPAIKVIKLCIFSLPPQRSLTVASQWNSFSRLIKLIFNFLQMLSITVIA